MSPQTLHNKTLFITGSSRGIGKAIALRAARDGAGLAGEHRRRGEQDERCGEGRIDSEGQLSEFIFLLNVYPLSKVASCDLFRQENNLAN